MKKSIFLFLLLLFGLKAFAQYPMPSGTSPAKTMLGFFKIAGSDTTFVIKDANGNIYPVSRDLIAKSTDFQGFGTLTSKFGLRDTILKDNWVFKSASTTLPALTLISSNDPGYTLLIKDPSGVVKGGIGTASGFFGPGIHSTRGESYIGINFDADSGATVFRNRFLDGSGGYFLKLASGSHTYARFDTTGFYATNNLDTANMTLHPNAFVTAKWVLAHSSGGGGSTVDVGSGLSGDGSSGSPISFGNIDGSGGTASITLNSPSGSGTAHFNIQDQTTSYGLHVGGNGTDFQTEINGGAMDFSNNQSVAVGNGVLILDYEGADTQKLSITGNTKGTVIQDNIGLIGASYQTDYSAAQRLYDNAIPSVKTVKLLADSVVAAHPVTTYTASGGVGFGTGGSANDIRLKTGTIAASVSIATGTSNTLSFTSTNSGNIGSIGLNSGVLTAGFQQSGAGLGFSQYSSASSDAQAKIGYQNSGATLYKLLTFGVANTGIQVREDKDSVGFDYVGISSAKQRLRQSVIPSIGTTIALIDSAITAHGGASGTVTSITPGIGFTSHTPITTSGTMDIDTASTIQTIANFFPKADTRYYTKTASDARYEVPLTFTSGVSRSSNTVKADTSVVRTVANSYSLSGMQTKLNNYALTSSLPVAGNPSGLLTFTAANGSNTAYTRNDGLHAIDSTVVRSVANSLSLSAAQTKFNLKANIASPTFTGTVTIPNGGVFGTPTSITLTNATGLPVSTGITGLGTGIATWLATPSSANLASALTDETGSGAAVFGTTPTFTTSIIDPLVVGSTSANGTLTLTGNNNASGNTATNRNIVFKTGNSSGAEAGYFTNNSTLVLNGLLSFGTGAGSGSGIYIYDGGSSTRIGMGQPTGGSFQNYQITGGFFSWNYGGGLQTAGTNEVMRALTAGSFGLLIGTTTDDGSSKLQVNGTAKATTFNSTSLTASKVVFTDASKNLTSTGIGTSSQYILGDGSLGTVGARPHTIFTPTTGGTVALTNNQYNIINPAGALVALTVNLPSSPANNDCVFIKYTQNITTVTYGNGTVVDGITAPTAGGLVVLTYDSGTTSWY